MAREGSRAGMPDLCLPVARLGYHALYLEFKILPNKPTQEQLNCIADLEEEGNLCYVVYSMDEGKDIVGDYLHHRLRAHD